MNYRNASLRGLGNCGNTFVRFKNCRNISVKMMNWRKCKDEVLYEYKCEDQRTNTQKKKVDMRNVRLLHTTHWIKLIKLTANLASIFAPAPSPKQMTSFTLNDKINHMKQYNVFFKIAKLPFPQLNTKCIQILLYLTHVNTIK